MEFKEVIKNRYSCKKYGTQKVEKEKLEAILEAGRLAPTAKNLQEQHIYVVESPEALAKIDKATPCRYGAPTVLVVAFDKNNVFTYPNNTNSYKYRRINNNVVTGINLFSEYLNENKQNTFIIDSYAYLIKINTNIPISKFDLLNDGNMGKNGQYKIINAFNNICQKNKCTFLLNKELITSAKYTQQNKEILQYIVNNYTEDGNILGLTIYKNK